jgi:NAD(P)-dependent dehydrogenase (short-subunit alcohol dehydrogenase family)
VVLNLRGAVVVVTGASSGIGRATAEAFARKGATVILAARREASLEEVAAECDRLGGRGRVYVLDVTDAEAVREMARWTVEHHGRIDVWVNNAAVYLLARFEDTPPDAFRRVIETDFFGYVNGIRAVLPYKREQDGGVIVNVGSIGSRITMPYTSAYVAAKHAVRGLSGSLRQELRGTNVHVCTVLPAVINTPLFVHTANYTGRRVKPMNPLNDPQVVADAIVGVAERPRPEVLAGSPGLLLTLMHAIAPGLVERQLAAQVDVDHFADEPAPRDDGNLYEPVAIGTEAEGEWTNTAPPPFAQKALAIAAGAATAALPVLLLARSGRNRPFG